MYKKTEPKHNESLRIYNDDSFLYQLHKKHNTYVSNREVVVENT
jgi:hypothetical protein